MKEHCWYSGRVAPCHDADPGSIPVQCTRRPRNFSPQIFSTLVGPHLHPLGGSPLFSSTSSDCFPLQGTTCKQVYKGGPNRQYTQQHTAEDRGISIVWAAPLVLFQVLRLFSFACTACKPFTGGPL